MKKILREPLFYLLPLLVLTWFWIIPAKPNVSDVVLTIDRISSSESFPISTYKIKNNSEFSVSFNMNIKKNENAVYRFYPDDCILGIEINGNAFPPEKVKKPCDYDNGTVIDLSEYTHKGLNKIELQIKNYGGLGGFKMEIPYNEFKSFIFTLLLLLSIALILRKFKFRFIAISIILLGIVVRLILYSYIGPMRFSYFDIDGHLQYIQIISEEKRLPKINEGWSTYHPPLYYVISAVIKNIADRYDTSITDRILQQENLLISFVYVILGVALILNLFGNSRVAYLAAFVSVLWPGFAIAGPRINNDSLFCLGALFCMLFAQRYWCLHKNSDMLLASIGASIALAGKSNGFVILAAWIVIYIFSVIRPLKIGSLQTLFASIFIVVLFIGFSNYRTIVGIFEGKKIELIGNVRDLDNSLRVNNTLYNYLYFDLQGYMKEPYTSSRDDKNGRQYFWNYSLKTSLFGEFRLWDSHVGNTFAMALSILALLIFMFALWGIIHAKFKDLPSLLFVIFLFVASICARVSYPYSCTNDFRYIFPVLFPLVYFATRGVQILEDYRLKILSYASMLLFAILSFLFITLPAFLV